MDDNQRILSETVRPILETLVSLLDAQEKFVSVLGWNVDQVRALEGVINVTVLQLRLEIDRLYRDNTLEGDSLAGTWLGDARLSDTYKDVGGGASLVGTPIREVAFPKGMSVFWMYERFRTVEELLQQDPEDLTFIRGVGPRTIINTIEAIEQEGIEIPPDSDWKRFEKEHSSPKPKRTLFKMGYISDLLRNVLTADLEELEVDLLVLFDALSIRSFSSVYREERIRLEQLTPHEILAIDLTKAVAMLYEFHESKEGKKPAKSFLQVYDVFRGIPEEKRRMRFEKLGIYPEMED